MSLNDNKSESDGMIKKRGPLTNLSPLAFIFVSLAVVFFLYQIVGGSLLYLILGEGLYFKNENLFFTRIVIAFSQFMFILFPVLILVQLQDNNFNETFRLKLPGLKVLLLSVLAILIVQPFLQVYLYYQNALIFSLPFGSGFIKQLKEVFDSLESATKFLVEAQTVPDFILIVLSIAVAPAICEEFLFRGLVFKNFEKVLSSSKSIFFTGLLFALFHFHPFNIVPLTILGIFLTFVVFHSGSIYTAVVCHFVNNFISALAVFVYGTDSLENIDNMQMTTGEQIQFVIIGIISVILFVLIMIVIKKNSLNKHPLSNEQ